MCWSGTVVTMTDRDDTSTTHKSRRTPLLLGAGALGLVLVLAAAWWLGFLTAEPEPVSITQAADTVSQESLEDNAEVIDQTSNATTAAESSVSLVSLDGEWRIVTSDATFVGYRADSQVGEAVGRSPGVSGTLTAIADQITAVTIIADMTMLESDSSVRDGHLGDEGIEHNIYPTSTFVLTEPIAVASIPENGSAQSFSAVGELTVKDITQSVTLDLEALVVDDKFIVAGDTMINLDDYGASVTSTNEALMEFSVVFAR